MPALFSCSLLKSQSTSPARLISPKGSSILRSTSATFSWTTGSGPTAYLLNLGTKGKGSDNTYSSGVTRATSVTVKDLPKSGETIYATLYSKIDGKFQSVYYTFIKAGLKDLSCAGDSITGQAADECAVTLSAPALEGGTIINLTSNDRAVSVPAKITVPANATRVRFKLVIAAVRSVQTVTLAAKSYGALKEFTLHLSEAKPVLTIDARDITFGDVTVGIPATQSVKLISKGTWALTVNSATVSGKGFTLSGIKFPLTLKPGEVGTLDVEFNPTKAAATKGELTLVSDSASGSKAAISLSGTGVEVPYQVRLGWEEPVDKELPIAGYYILRAISGNKNYQLLNPLLDTGLEYVDETVQDGVRYDYVVESVDIYGVPSEPSEVFSLTIP